MSRSLLGDDLVSQRSAGELLHKLLICITLGLKESYKQRILY